MRLIVRAVGLAGVEPATSPLSGVRSNQLSYSPERMSDRSGATYKYPTCLLFERRFVFLQQRDADSAD